MIRKVIIALRESLSYRGNSNLPSRRQSVLLNPFSFMERVGEGCHHSTFRFSKGHPARSGAGGIPFIGDSPAVGSLTRAAEKFRDQGMADEMNPSCGFNRLLCPGRRRKYLKS